MREKKSRKNIIRRMVSGFSAFAIALALCFVAIPETVHASDYELTSVCITGDGRKKVMIPSVVKDDKGVEYKVTKVEGKAFYKNKKVRSVTVPSTVTSIGGGAFKYCSNLNNIKLNGNTLKSIGKGAFSNIKEGATITIVAKNKKTFDKIVKKIKKSGAKNVKYKFKKG